MPSKFHRRKFHRRQARRVALTIAAPIIAALFMYLSPNAWMWG